MGKRSNVEDIYPLSPLQQGLLFHSVYAPGSAAYCEQLGLRLPGSGIDAAALARAVQAVVDLHPILRTAFVHARRERPLQVVSRRVTVPLAVVEGEELATVLARDREAGFDLARAPLLRASLVRTAEGACHLVLTYHHILLDGWSVRRVCRDLLAAYVALAAAREPELARPRPYRSYVEWLERQDLAAAEAFWREELAGFGAATVLAFDRAPDADSAAAGSFAEGRIELSPRATRALRERARRGRLTVNTVALAAWGVLLGRGSGEEDVLFGTVVAGRPDELPGIDEMVGLFINTLPARVRLPPAAALWPWLAELQGRLFARRRFEYTPLPQIQRWSALPGRDLFSSLVDFENYGPEAGAAGGEETIATFEQTHYPLTLDLRLEPVLSARLLYDRRRFDAATVERLLRHFVTVLEAIAGGPDRPLDSLPLLTAAEVQALVVEPPAGGAPAPPRCLHAWFEEVAARAPAAPAVTFEGVDLTYRELDRQANRLAHYLVEKGVGPDVRVGVCLEREARLVVVLLAVLKAGGAYVPLDPLYPRERVELILDDAGISLLVTRRGLADFAFGSAVRRVALEDAEADLAGRPAASPRVPVLPGNLAYVIYTSGTTGRPKGVLISHANVARLFTATADRFGFGPRDVVTLFHSYSFDFSVWEMWAALLHGGRLVGVPYLVGRSPAAFYELLCREGVTCLSQTPSAFRQLVRHEEAAGADPRLRLRHVVFGGEALDPRSLGPWYAAHGEAAPLLVNMYGITETTVHVTCRPMAAADQASAASPLGQPIPDLRLVLLDRRGRLVPAGVPGEICVGGAGLARGYHGRPELTAERFVPDPFHGEPGARLYRSGDLARRRGGGELEYLGRLDHQVKVRGFRIEPGEVETVLRRHPAVREAVVVAREAAGMAGERRLVAYCVPRPGEALDGREARAFVARSLPDYMVPSAVVAVEALPLTASGKLDRRALAAAEPAAAAVAAAADYTPPETTVEAALAGIWGRVLHVERVGAEDDFFALGGDSILSLQVLYEAREQGLDLSLQQLFRHPTVRALAREIGGGPGERPRGAARAPLAQVDAEDRGRLPAGLEDAFPLSRLQAGMLFLSRLEPESALYHNVRSYALHAPFDEDKLRAAIRELVARHPILRTAFDLETFGEPLQLVFPAAEVELAVDDLRHLPRPAARAAVSVWFEAEKQRHFDWTRAGLLRFHVHLRDGGMWQFSLTEHHAILDGWSVALLLTELFQIYSHLLGGGPLPAAPPALRYGDFVALERAAIASPEQREFWLARLQGSGRTELPRWPGRAAAPGGAPARKVAIPADRLSRLNRLALAAGAPLKSVLLAAHLRVLAFASGEEEVVTGLVMNGRLEEAEGERVLGLFLNTLPLRLRLPEAGTWRELVRRTFDEECAMLPHRRFPLAELQQALGGAPLFETLVNFVRFHVYENLQEPAGLRVVAGDFFEATNFRLSADFRLAPAGDAGELSLSCRDDLDAVQVELLADAYARVLAAMAEDPEGSLRDVPLLAAWQRHLLVHEANATAGGREEDPCVHEMIAAQARRVPGRVAVACGEAALTYGELLARAAELAGVLHSLGVGPEVPVGIFLERSPEMVVALLAVLTAGGAYLPLDSSYPADRLAMILEDLPAPVLLTHAATAGKLPACPHPAVRLDVDRLPPRRGGPAAFLPVEGSPDRLAYVLFTSGSTGRPKGVQVPHRALANFLLAMRERPGLAESDRLLAVTTLAFDIAGLEIFLPLIAGATVVVAARAEAADAALLARRLEETAATALQATPSTFRALLEAGWRGRSGLQALCGGEAWPPSLAAALCAAAGPVWNVYGPTETTIWSAVGRIEADELPGFVPVGEPIRNTELHVATRRFELAPLLVPGELCIGGTGVARGYAGRPDLTAERFVPDPWSGRPGARLYRTGDLVRRLPRGGFEFLGRLDSQVKVRGFRIELGEIEAVLSAHPAVRQAVAAVREDRPGDPRLAAYLTAHPGPEPGGGELRSWLARRLPEYMVPATFTVLERLPLTPNGKVDRRALPAPHAAEEEAGRPALDPAAELLANLWAEVLATEASRIGPADSFFALGGHSLLASRLLARIRRVFGVELTLRRLFERPTLGGMAGAIRQAAGAGEPLLPPLEPLGAGDEPPLSFAQERFWVLDQIQPGNPAYNLPLAVRIEGTLGAAALARALAETVGRHATLRSRFPAAAGRATLVIEPDPRPDLPLIDLSGLPEDRREGAASRLASAWAALPFDLARGPLLRAALLRTGGEEHRLLLVIHHIVCDEQSLGLLAAEVAALYGSFASGQPAALPALPLQYHDYAAWQRRWLQGEALERQLDYWRGSLAGARPHLDLPTDRPRPAVQTFRGAMRPLALPPRLSQELRRLARQCDGTVFMVLLAAFQDLLGRYAHSDDVVVGCPVSGRRTVELEGLVGLFVNTLALRGRRRDDEPFAAWLGRTRECVLEAHAHQDMPFEKLVDDLQPERSLAGSPLFQVMLVFQGRTRAADRSRGVRLSALPPAGGTAKFDLTLFVADREEGIGGFAEFDTGLFDGATVVRLLGHLEALLAAAAEDPGRTLAELPLLAPAERHHLLLEWNDTAGSAPSGLLLHRLLAAQASRTPSALAVVCGGERITYGELARRARRWTRRLRAAGAGPGGVVALCCERGGAMLAAIWAILEAGAAYLPLDPALPRERLAFMLEESGAVLLLAQESLLGALPERRPPVLPLDREPPDAGAAAGAERDGDAAAAVWPQSLAYVLYTSGSTGRPKGVMVPHRAVAHYLTWCAAAYRVADGWGAPVHSSLGFDLTVTSLFAPLLAGRAVQLLPGERGGEELAAAFAGDEGYSLIKLTPSHLDLLALQVPAERLAGKVGALVVGGEALIGGPGLDRFLRHAPATRIVNEYGPTETTVGCCVYELAAGDGGDGKAVPIGRPIAETRLYVVDRGLRPVPLGIPGELLIGGRGLARGYLGRPDATAERFVPCPFGEARGERLYRSGDLVRALPDGKLVFLGRIDQQTKIRGYRIEPGEIETALRAHPDVREAVVAAGGPAGRRRLAAWFVPGGGRQPDPGELRSFLARSLPDYMIPSDFVALSEVPLTANGKVDRARLPAPEAVRQEAPGGSPLSRSERILAGIFADLLGRGAVGVDESFFHLGGDSIQAIQLVARAARQGLTLVPRQVFQHPTVAALAAVAAASAAGDRAAEPVEGGVPLTPIQRWFFAQDLPERHHDNQALLLELPAGLDPAWIGSAVEAALAHHDALRLRFTHEDGAWRQSYGAAGPLRLAWLDLSGLPAAAGRPALEEAAARLQRSLDLGRGPLARAALFDLGAAGRRLLLIVHHLVVDGVSWRVLLDDLETVYRQAAAGEPLRLPARTASLKAWAEALVRSAASGETLDELPFWLASVPAAPGRLRARKRRRAAGTPAAWTVSRRLGAPRTAALLGEAPLALHARVQEILLAALVYALHRWSGIASVLLDLESHGREESIGEGLDVSRTVGWFTSIFPLGVELAPGDGPEAALRRVKERLRAVPRRGLGFGLLRDLCPLPDVARQVRALPRSELLFNYLGQFDDAAPGERSLRLAAESAGPVRSDRGRRAHRLEVNAWVAGGELRCDWTFSPHVFAPSAIERLAGGFRTALLRLLAPAAAASPDHLSASDFPLARLEEARLRDLLRGQADVEDLYPLSPLQEALLVHGIAAPRSAAGFEQASFRLAGELDAAAFERAWRRAVARNPVLRTCFVTAGTGPPLQLVRRAAELPAERLDWSGASPREQDERLGELLAADRERGFDFAAAPLMRLHLVRTAPQEHVCVVSYHHILLDGWCQPLLFGEVFSLYESFRRGLSPELPGRRPFRDYIAWMLERDPAPAQPWWRERLRGFLRPTPLRLPPPAPGETAGGGEPGRCDAVVPAAAASALRDAARGRGITLAALVHAAWALLLARRSGHGDVVLGTTVSGRPAELPGVEGMLGMFVNNLPLRVVVPEEQRVPAWLDRVQAELVDLRQFEHTPLLQVQDWSEVPRGRRLFDSLVVFQNYPADAPLASGGLRIEPRAQRLETDYPLTLVADASRELAVRAYFSRERFDAGAVAAALRQLAAVLASLPAAESQTPWEIPLLGDEERRQVAARPAAAGPQPETLLALFAEQVRRAPHAVALRRDGAAHT
jgi:amino acid adenylation domain-containing protein/non-ribosomal peptide synthase protein (TIGR01720 family)